MKHNHNEKKGLSGIALVILNGPHFVSKILNKMLPYLDCAIIPTQDLLEQKWMLD